MEFDYTSTTRPQKRESAEPRSLRDITEQATKFDYNPLIPLRFWLRTAESLHKQSQIYLKEGDEQQAYILLLRWTELMLQYLIQHPERNFPDNARALRRLQSRLPEAFRTLEQIKPRLETRYLALVAARQRVAIPHAPAAAQRGISVDGWLSRTSHPSDNERNDRNLAAETTTQETDRNYALEIAKLEFGNWERAQLQRRQTVANTSGKGVVVDHTGTVIRRVPAEDPAVSRRSYYETVEERREREAREGDEDMMESIKALSMGIDLSQHNGSKRDSYNKRNSTSEYDFQGFPQHEVETRNRPIEGNWAGFYPTIPRSLHSQTVYVPAPPLPLLPTPPAFTSPPLPPKIPTSNAPALPPKVVEKPAAPATQPHQFSMPATLENGTRLRTLFLPSPLRDTFLAIAQDNTDANLETCGVLCGKLVQNALFVSRLVIPEQTATSDTCTTRDEEALFEYCHNEDLMVFGWIHTHPTQTCFMSSVDLHTHSGYQLMMAESIAIVCAPSKTPSWGVFRLTDPPGVQTIVACRDKGLFHPHAVDNIYTDAQKPGHVTIMENMGFDVVDLRKR